MAVLSNPIDNDNIISRFEDYVRASANSGIVWHSSNLPFPESTMIYGPSTGKAAEISGASLTNPITANQIFNVLLTETQRYTRCRLLRAVRVVDGDGDEPGPPGVNFDSTQKASLNFAYQLSPSAAQVITAGAAVDDSVLETQLQNFQNAYLTGESTVAYLEIHVCHSSCHQSCHSSRSRR